MPHEFTAITYNLFADVPQFRYLDQRIEMIARALGHAAPDVVAFQELVKGPRCGDTAARLETSINSMGGAHRYRLDYLRADGIDDPEWGFEEGIGLLSRVDLLSDGPDGLRYKAQVRMSAAMGGTVYRFPDDRVAIHAHYALPTGLELDFYATHLTDQGPVADGPRVRLLQVRELLEWVKATAASHSAVIIAGDLNDVPDSAPIREILKAGFFDAHTVAGQGPGYTNDSHDLRLDACEAHPDQRIDYIFLRPDPGGKFNIVRTELFLDRPTRLEDGGWLWASDHIGVAAVFAIG